MDKAASRIKIDNALLKVLEMLRRFTALSFIFLFLLLLVKAFEIIFVGGSHGFPPHSGVVIFKSLQYDLLYFLKASWWLLIVFFPLYFISRRLALTIYGITAILLVIIEIALIQYFSAAMVPLGADLFGYSLAEIRQTVGAAGGLRISVAAGFVIVLILFIIAFRVLPKKIKPGKYAAISLALLAFLTVLLRPQGWMASPAIGSEFTNSLVLNKCDFFFGKSYAYFFPEDEHENDIYADSYLGDFGDSGDGNGTVSFHYVDEQQYPFLHVDSTEDVLSSFINKGATPPDIVIIIVEGLGRAFTNAGAYLGNFTPFVDSLSGKSLYWDNFLSEGGRTFAVMPSILGSLPFGKNGFAELGNNMPPDISLLSLLKLNGYYTAYYGSFDSHFDNTHIFLQKQSIDAINDEKTFPAGYNKLPASASGFTWGYGDKELYRRFFEVTDRLNRHPEISVLQTVATHSPFLVPDEDKYLQKFENRMNQLGFNEQQKREHENYKLQYASILYMDDALREFFGEFEKRAEFKNTIFLITGDHRMPEIPMSTRIDRYHVPLIIYSPLLKRTAEFSAISTHFDITPSLLCFLKTNYNMKMPSLVSWMGSGLDTARNLRNIHAYPLMQTKTNLVDFVMGSYLINNDELFQIGRDLDLEPLSDQGKLNQLKAAFNRFKERNNRFISGAKLIPDSIYRKYHP